MHGTLICRGSRFYVCGSAVQLKRVSPVLTSRINNHTLFIHRQECKMSTTSNNMNQELLEKVFDLVKRHNLISGQHDRSGKVVEFVQPEELASKIGDLSIGQNAVEDSHIDDILEAVVKYSVKTCHPHFYNQLYHGSDAAGLAGQWLSDALNTNGHTFEVAPVFLTVEKALINYVIGKLGWQTGDGLTCPGGSLANMYGLMLARHQKVPDVKAKGLANSPPMVVYTSEDSHYSVLKGANWMGLGTQNVVKVSTDGFGKMIPDELEKAVQKTLDDGKVPLAVNATSGTTVLGAYDDLVALTRVCQKFQLWCHVDACWGGSAMISDSLKHLLNGIDMVDSVAWNPHKMLGAPLQSNIFATKHKGLLEKCNSASAGYLFQPDKFYDVSYDTGDKSVQCGRKVDAFQVWFMLKTRGEKYFENLINNAFGQAEFLAQQIRERDGFELVVDPHSCTNVCFVHVPPSLRNGIRDDKWKKELSKVPPKIKERMTMKGSLLIGYQPLPHKNLDNFFRMVIHGVPEPTNQDMIFILDEIERCGSDL